MNPTRNVTFDRNNLQNHETFYKITQPWAFSNPDFCSDETKVSSDAGTGGARGAMAPPIFGRSVNPIPTGKGRLSPLNQSVMKIKTGKFKF